jgi:hypothetical protein
MIRAGAQDFVGVPLLSRQVILVVNIVMRRCNLFGGLHARHKSGAGQRFFVGGPRHAELQLLRHDVPRRGRQLLGRNALLVE